MARVAEVMLWMAAQTVATRALWGIQCGRRQPTEHYCWIQWIGFLAHRNQCSRSRGKMLKSALGRHHHSSHPRATKELCVRVGEVPHSMGSAVHAFKACRHSTSLAWSAWTPTNPTPTSCRAATTSLQFLQSWRGHCSPLRAELFRLRSSLVHHISCDECGCVCACVSRSRRRRSQCEGQQSEAPCCPHHAVRVGSVGRRVRTLVAPMGHTQSSCHLSPNSKYSEYSFTTLLI